MLVPSSYPDWLERYAERHERMYGEPFDKASFADAVKRNRAATRRAQDDAEFDHLVDDLQTPGR